MKRTYPLVGLVMLCVLTVAAAKQLTPAVVDDNIAVFFSPKGGCTDAVINQIDGVKKTLDVQAYSFTSGPIHQAIVRAKERGVAVRVVLDKSNDTDKYSGATYLFNHEVQVWIDKKHAIAHNKIMILDGKSIITGSFNFTKAAESSNAENLLILNNKPKIATAYTENFNEHLEHSVKYDGIEKKD